MGRPRSKTWAWVSTLDAMANRGTADTGRTPCGLRHARRGAGGMGPDSRNGGYIFPFFKTDLFIPDQYGNPASALLSRGGGPGQRQPRSRLAGHCTAGPEPDPGPHGKRPGRAAVPALTPD